MRKYSIAVVWSRNDELGRRVSRAHGDGSTTLSRTYDKASRPASMTEAVVTQTYRHNFADRLTGLARHRRLVYASGRRLAEVHNPPGRQCGGLRRTGGRRHQRHAGPAGPHLPLVAGPVDRHPFSSSPDACGIYNSDADVSPAGMRASRVSSSFQRATLPSTSVAASAAG